MSEPNRDDETEAAMALPVDLSARADKVWFLPVGFGESTTAPAAAQPFHVADMVALRERVAELERVLRDCQDTLQQDRPHDHDLLRAMQALMARLDAWGGEDLAV